MNTLTRQCPNCNDTLPAEARFCSSCGTSLPPLIEEEKEKDRGGLLLPFTPGTQAAATAGLSSSVQGSAAMSAGFGAAAQGGASTVPGMAAGPQSAAPGVPTIAGGPQGAGASAPGMPGVAQTGSTGLQGVAQGAGHGLLGTLPAKIIAGVLAVVVVAGGTAAALAATGTRLPIFGSSSGSQPSGAHPTSVPQKSPTAAPAPNGAPADSATFTITLNVTKAGSVHIPGNPQNMLLVMGGTVCGPHDDGKPFTYPDPDIPGQTDTTTTTCSGTYQGGKLNYTQMILQITFANEAGTCTTTAASPWTVHLEGTFTSPTSVSGTVTQVHAPEPLTCSNGSGSVPAASETGTFTGTLNTTTTP